MAVAREPEEEGGIIWLDDDEARAHFDARARELLGISGEEFLRRYDAGEYDEIIDADDGEHWQVMELSMLTSFGR